MTQENKTTPTTSKEGLFIKALDSKGKKAVYNLYVAVSNTRVNSFVANDIASVLLGSDKALFNLGVVSGQNAIIRQFKAIIEGNK
jgi:hypothetical protein|tara:strand:- start:409 stop:663 length:255 start_codon:yes stop_codon:yes gene_type:complete